MKLARKYTVELGAALVADAMRGYFPQAIAARNGVAYASLKRWLAVGSDPQCTDPELAELAVAWARAMADHECALQDAIDTSQQSGVKYLLERRHSERWAQRVRVELEEQLDTYLDLLESKLDAQSFEIVLGVLSGDVKE